MRNLNRRQLGSYLVEYSVGTAILLLAMFADVPGSELSAVDALMQALRSLRQSSALLLSLP